MGVTKRDHSYINDEKLGQSYTFSWKKGAYRIPGSAKKGGYSARTSILCHIGTSQWHLMLIHQTSPGLEISENRHLPSITKFIGIHGENLIFSRNIKIFTCPAA